MKGAYAKSWWPPTAKGVPALAVTASFFALGGLCGCLLALNTAPGGNAEMVSFLGDYFQYYPHGVSDLPALCGSVWRTVRWPLAAVLMGASALGVLAIPVLCFLRGFFLSFSIAAIINAYHSSGLLSAFLLLGVPAFLTLPAFFLLSVQSFYISAGFTKQLLERSRLELPLPRNCLLICCACAAATWLGLVLEGWLLPILFSGLSGFWPV